MKQWLMAALACAALSGCAAPQSQAQQADNAACTAQGDVLYNNDTIDEQGHTAQNGLLYGATPTHVFDAEQMGAMHQRDSAISQCEANGNSDAPAALGGGTPVAPHIVQSP